MIMFTEDEFKQYVNNQVTIALSLAIDECQAAKNGAIKHYGIDESVGAEMCIRRIEALKETLLK